MSDNLTELTAKRKRVVNREMFFSAPRMSSMWGMEEVPWTTEASSLHGSMVNWNGPAAYFQAPQKDKLRITLGKNWDFRQRNPENEDLLDKEFSNNWGTPLIWRGDGHMHLDLCGPLKTLEVAGDFGHSKSVLQQDVVVYVEKGYHKFTEADFDHEYGFLSDWLYWMKTGATFVSQNDTATTYTPIIEHGKFFKDHFHYSINPFTPEELVNEEPAGKAFFADFKTYYNERFRGGFQSSAGSFEEIIGKKNHIQNSIPSIYSFLRLFLNSDLIQTGYFNLAEIISYLQDYFISLNNVLYKDLLKKYPLETALLLYGAIGYTKWSGGELAPDYQLTMNEGSKIVERIIASNFDVTDADELFSNYYQEYTDLISRSSKLSGYTSFVDYIPGIENIMTNLVFSPNSTKLMNKVDQYKKYFPFYTELQFSANLLTSIGDMMKKYSMTKPMSEAVLSHVGNYETAWPVWFTSGAQNYIDHTEKNIYETISPTGIPGQIELSINSISETSKQHQDFPALVKHWITGENIEAPFSNPNMKVFLTNAEGIYAHEHYDAANQAIDKEELRNFVTHFQDDNSPAANLDDACNVLYKKLFGTAFYGKLLDTYNKNKRTYEDIINGVPAYTEDLFYRIQKSKYAPVGEGVNQGKSVWSVVQNIVIPNTSDLDIVKYVDTQLKYSDKNSGFIKYKYEVFVHRLVFGSQYNYSFLSGQSVGGDSPQVTSAPPSAPTLVELADGSYNGKKWQDYDPSETDGLSSQITNYDPFNPFQETRYKADVRIEILPSILLIEDKIFTTNDVIILDKPPVPPDVNIIPYRAVSNQIKILMTGTSDRYREKPILILDTDEEEFEKIMAAQYSPDGKVEFGSDDPVTQFQILRTKEEPKTYKDFELHQQVDKQFFEEQILPNTKYYYTFRAIDSHNHVSNPTEVYEVELIDEKGAVKPMIRLFDMEQPENRSNIKDCQKYIYLRPTPKQLYFSDDENVDTIFCDTSKKKSYKMRLTSKGTGKKIDINFSFKKKF